MLVKARPFAASLLLFLATAAASALVLAGCGPSDEEKIKLAQKVDADFVKAFKREDLEGVMATYWNDPHALMLPTGAMTARGPAAIRAGYKAFFDGTNVKDFRLHKQEYLVLGDAVLGTGLFTLTTEPSLGPVVTIEGRYSEVVAKRDDKWVYIHDHVSVPLSPNATAETVTESVRPALPPIGGGQESAP
jgi:ketosteroid isomerase-like protein